MATSRLIAQLAAAATDPDAKKRQDASGVRTYPLAIVPDNAGDEVEVHDQPPAQPRPSAYLQLWTLGQAEVNAWRGPAVARPAPPAIANYLCTELSGYVRRIGSTYQFVETKADAPVPDPSGELLDSIVLRLGASAERPVEVRGSGLSMRVHLCVRLSSTRLNKDPRGLTTASGFEHPCLLAILARSVRRGLTMVFAFENDAPKDELASSQNQALLLAATQSAELVEGLTLTAAGLDVGPTFVTGAGALDLLTDAVEAVTTRLKHMTSAGGYANLPSTVSALLTLSPGAPSKGQPAPTMVLGNPDTTLAVNAVSLKVTLKRLTPLLADDVRWALLGRLLGAHPGAIPHDGDADSLHNYGGNPGTWLRLPEDIGRGSFAHALREALVEAGCAKTVVWAQASAGHALLNPELRVFTRDGNVDLRWLCDGIPLRPAEVVADDRKRPAARGARRAAWRQTFANEWSSGGATTSDAERQARSWALLRVLVTDPRDAVQRRLLERRCRVAGETTVLSDPPTTPPSSRDHNFGLIPGWPVETTFRTDPNCTAVGDHTTCSCVVKTPRAGRAGGRVFLQQLTRDCVGPPKTTSFAERETLILEQLRLGNMPDYCRQWVEVRLVHKEMRGSVWVLPDCLAVGTNTDFVRVNLTAYGSEQIAKEWGCFLPTKMICRAIFHQATDRALMHPLNASSGSHQSSNLAMQCHEDLIQAEVPEVNCDTPLPDAWVTRVAKGFRWSGDASKMTAASDDAVKQLESVIRSIVQTRGAHESRCVTQTKATNPRALTSGHKKEVIIHPGVDSHAKVGGNPPPNHQLYFYGFVGSDKAADQYPDPLDYAKVRYTYESTIFAAGESKHGAGFTDYAQGTRLVYPWMQVDGEWRLYNDVLMDRRCYKLLCGEEQAEPYSEHVRYPIPEKGSDWQMGQ